MSVARRSIEICVQVDAPVLLWGAPGVGKSALVRDVARTMGLPVEVIIASLREPADFSGLPVISNDRESVFLCPPSWARRLAARPGILFLDEITCAPTSVQAALLRVVLDRVVGDLPLHPGTRVVAAANPPEISAGGSELSLPLANRFCHLWANPPAPKALAEFLRSGKWPERESSGTLRVPEDYYDGIEGMCARALVASFLEARGELVHSMPMDREESSIPDDPRGDDFLRIVAWPSPRTWEMATRVLAAARAAGAPPDVCRALVSGCVGPEAASELLHFERLRDLPDPETLLADPKSASRLSGKRSDIIIAALSAVAAAVRENHTTARWTAAWYVLLEVQQRDLAIPAARILAEDRRPGEKPPIRALEVFGPLLLP
ncbi:MAG: MoxR family ATPase [candidate division KSB1 bacterium]|nr:MoxR family ATPase [candidate division KSB1 bacterium]